MVGSDCGIREKEKRERRSGYEWNWVETKFKDYQRSQRKKIEGLKEECGRF